MDLAIEKQVGRKTILARNWLNIHVDETKFDGVGTAMERIVLEHPGAAGVLAITNDHEVVLVKQYRYAASRILYEIPAGKNNHWQSNFEETAKRELAEETPYTAGAVELLYQFYVAPGYSDERIFLYKATNLQKNSKLMLDEGESLQVKLFKKPEIEKMLHDGTICDSKTIIALQYWLHANE